jgi:hypothetical protein
MQDQFVTAGEKIIQLQQLCVPVDDGGGITNPAVKLTCYRTKYTGARFRGPATPVFVNNEFGGATIESSHGEELCLPFAQRGVRRRRWGLSGGRISCAPPVSRAGRAATRKARRAGRARSGAS